MSRRRIPTYLELAKLAEYARTYTHVNWRPVEFAMIDMPDVTTLADLAFDKPMQRPEALAVRMVPMPYIESDGQESFRWVYEGPVDFGSPPDHGRYLPKLDIK